MKMNFKPYYALLAIAIALVGCTKENNTPSKNNDGFIVTKNNADLRSRVNLKNQDIVLAQTDTELKSALNFNYSLTLVAEVLAPVFEGDTLQASHIIFEDEYALVAYNTQGEQYLGGLELFDISDLDKPALLWSSIMPEADFSALDYKNLRIFITGAQNMDYNYFNLASPAFMAVVKVDTVMNFAGLDTAINLQSYAGTDVRAEANRVYATSGSNGYFKAFDWDYNELFSAQLDDLRSVDYNSKYVCVLQGTPGRVQKYNKSDFSHYFEISVGGANIPGSKSDIQLMDNMFLAALNEGGVKAFNLSGTSLYTIAKPETPAGGNPDNYVSNSLSYDRKCGFLFIANGGAGIHVLKINNNVPNSIGNIMFDDNASTNFVAVDGKVMFAAAGKGGLKIVKMKRK
jgi:hypothetical protein